MNIFAFLKDRTRVLYGIPLEEVEAQLRAGRFSLLEGTIFTDSGLFIKCTGEIYQRGNDKVTSSKLKSPNQCYNVMSTLNIKNCSPKDCAACHLKAIGMYKEKELKKRRK